MKLYTHAQYTGKTKQKRIFRIVFLSLLTAGILWGILLLGNLFGDRLTSAADLLALDAGDHATASEKPEAKKYDAPPKKRPLTETFFSPALAPSAYETEKALKSALDAIPAGERGLSVTVRDKDGARFSLTALGGEAPSANALPLSTVVTLAKEKSLSVCALFHTTYSAKADAAALCELADLGIREILLSGLTGDALTNDETYTLLLYLEMLRGEAPEMTVGIALSPEIFGDAPSAAHLDVLLNYFDYLALDLSATDGTSHVQSTLESLPGSLSYYDLAVLLKADVFDAISDTLTSLNVKAVRCLS